MRLGWTLFVLLALSTALCAGECSFMRDMKWGMTQSEVKAAEQGEPLVEKDTIIGYAAQLDCADCNVFYTFTGGELDAVMWKLDITNASRFDQMMQDAFAGYTRANNPDGTVEYVRDDAYAQLERDGASATLVIIP